MLSFKPLLCLFAEGVAAGSTEAVLQQNANAPPPRIMPQPLLPEGMEDAKLLSDLSLAVNPEDQPPEPMIS